MNDNKGKKVNETNPYGMLTSEDWANKDIRNALIGLDLMNQVYELVETMDKLEKRGKQNEKIF